MWKIIHADLSSQNVSGDSAWSFKQSNQTPILLSAENAIIQWISNNCAAASIYTWNATSTTQLPHDSILPGSRTGRRACYSHSRWLTFH